MTVNLLDVGSGFKRTAINSNFETIETELNDNVLTKDGGTQLEADLDFNSNRAINVANGINNSDAVTVGQLNGAISAAGSGLISSQQETQLGSEASGQVFTFSGISYTVGGNNLFVFQNGVKLYKDRDYTETSSSSITVNSDIRINDNDNWDFITNLSTTNSTTTTSAITHTESGTDYNLATYLQNRHVVNVKDFGAAGDGVTDDTAAIQSAIDSGKTIVLTDGTYLAKDLTPSAYTHIIGAGGVLKLLGSSDTDTAIFSYSGATQLDTFILDGVRLDGNIAGQSGAVGNQSAINIANTKEIIVRDCQLKDFYYRGVRVAGGTGTATNDYGSVDNVLIQGNTFNNVEGSANQILQAQNVSIVGNTFEDTGSAGGSGSGVSGAAIFVNNSGVVSINGNVSSRNSDSAIYCEDCVIGTITGNVVTDAAKTGIKWQGNSTENVIIDGNTVKLVGAQGVAVWATTPTVYRGIISNNVIDTACSPNTTFAQVEVTAAAGIYSENAKDILIEDNIVIKAGDSGGSAIKSGIYVQECDNANVKGNNVSESDNDGISIINCTSASISKNTSYNNGLDDDAVYNGIRVNNGATAATYISITDNYCYDTQGTKTQDYGARVSGSMWGTLKFQGNRMRDTDHATGGVLIDATNITVNQSDNMVITDNILTFTASDTSPSVAFAKTCFTDTGTLTITDFDNGLAGQEITVISKGAITYDTTGTNLTGSSADIVTASGDVTRWICEDGTTWRLIAYVDSSANNSTGA